MRIGMMNNPSRDPLREIAWAAAYGFDFIDLTLEHPKAGADIIDSGAIRAALDAAGLGVVGHGVTLVRWTPDDLHPSKSMEVS